MIGADFDRVLSAARRGDRAAFERLYADVNPALLRYLSVTAAALADDIASDTWLSVIKGLPKFRGKEPDWRNWLFTIARRRAVDTFRKLGREPHGAGLDQVPEPGTPDSADAALENLSTDKALQLISTLSPVEAECVLLRVVAGLDVAAVARLVGRRPGAVRVATHRGLRTLAARLTEGAVTQ